LIRRLLIVVLCSFAVYGCNKGNPVAPTPPSGNGNLFYFTITEAGMPFLRSGEQYILWLKTLRDTTWQKITELGTMKIVNGLVVIVGKFNYPTSLDSITNALVTIQPPNISNSTLNFPVLEGHNFLYDSAHKLTNSLFISKNTLGDFSALQGGLVFTSTKPDSLAYTHEFYLMNFMDSIPKPSLTSLPAPPVGWKYGLWAQDSNFTPHEFFLYGLFSSAQGRDSDSANAYYPFPGGWKPQQMNFGSGSIIVTLEPQFYGDSLKYKGPSPFTLLSFNRIRFINENENYPMTNISASAIPTGSIEFQQY